MLLNLLSNLLGNKDFAQVEIVVVLMPIFFAQSMLAFGQYEMKSSEASRLSVGQFKSLKPQQFPLHASKLAFKSIEK